MPAEDDGRRAMNEWIRRRGRPATEPDPVAEAAALAAELASLERENVGLAAELAAESEEREAGKAEREATARRTFARAVDAGEGRQEQLPPEPTMDDQIRAAVMERRGGRSSGLARSIAAARRSEELRRRA